MNNIKSNPIYIRNDEYRVCDRSVMLPAVAARWGVKKPQKNYVGIFVRHAHAAMFADMLNEKEEPDLDAGWNEASEHILKQEKE